jgi:hypothetical protein
MKNLYFAGIRRIDYYKTHKRLSVVQFTCSICSDTPSDQATPDQDNSVDHSDKEMYNWKKIINKTYKNTVSKSIYIVNIVLNTYLYIKRVIVSAYSMYCYFDEMCVHAYLFVLLFL